MIQTNDVATFLLVEDDEIDVMSVQRAMKREGIANPLVVARDGVEALEILRGDDPVRSVPSQVIILLDLNMPRMNGHEFLRSLRDDPNLAPMVVFVLTSSKLEADIHQPTKRTWPVISSSPKLGVAA